MKKLVNVVLVCLVAFGIMTSNISAWKIDDWVTGPGFGSKRAINDNVTNLQGKAGEGPYSKSSKQRLVNGISENINIELTKDNYTHGELFELSVSLDSGKKEYVNESIVMVQKVQDYFVVTSTIDSDFKAIIKDDGVYTFQYNSYIKDKKVYTNFKLLLWDNIIARTNDIDYDAVVGPDTKHPILDQGDVATRSVWFPNIQAKNGVNVWTNLPKKPADSESTPDSKPSENPNTNDDIGTYIVITILGFSALLFSAKKALQ